MGYFLYRLGHEEFLLKSLFGLRLLCRPSGWMVAPRRLDRSANWARKASPPRAAVLPPVRRLQPRRASVRVWDLCALNVEFHGKIGILGKAIRRLLPVQLRARRSLQRLGMSVAFLG